MLVFQKGFHFRQDGPGNRLVYHLQGCNLHCPWCSNPEGMSLQGGTEVSVAQMLEECLRSRPMFFGGGGVTFTGGEATVQAEELECLLHFLQAEGIHTAMETNGTSKRLPRLAAAVDYLMMDFKHWDGAAHRRFTGLDNGTVKENYEYFCKTGRQLHVRIPLIGGVNAADPAAFASYFATQNTQNCVFEFLPYHEYGKGKWKTEYQMKDAFVSAEVVRKFTETFARYGLRTVVT